MVDRHATADDHIDHRHLVGSHRLGLRRDLANLRYLLDHGRRQRGPATLVASIEEVVP